VSLIEDVLPFGWAAGLFDGLVSILANCAILRTPRSENEAKAG
jgi:hypothetical protein